MVSRYLKYTNSKNMSLTGQISVKLVYYPCRIPKCIPKNAIRQLQFDPSFTDLVSKYYYSTRQHELEKFCLSLNNMVLSFSCRLQFLKLINLSTANQFILLADLLVPFIFFHPNSLKMVACKFH